MDHYQKAKRLERRLSTRKIKEYNIRIMKQMGYAHYFSAPAPHDWWSAGWLSRRPKKNKAIKAGNVELSSLYFNCRCDRCNYGNPRAFHNPEERHKVKSQLKQGIYEKFQKELPPSLTPRFLELPNFEEYEDNNEDSYSVDLYGRCFADPIYHDFDNTDIIGDEEFLDDWNDPYWDAPELPSDDKLGDHLWYPHETRDDPNPITNEEFQALVNYEETGKLEEFDA